MQKNKFILFLILWIGLITGSFGQTTITSPYSRFGIGDIQNSISAINIGMGDIKYAYRSPFTVNYSNPASYTAISNNSFVFDGGLVTSFDNLATTDLKQNANFVDLNNLLFGFPITKWWKSSFGIVPMSRVGYNISDNEYDPNLQDYVEHTYEGSGGINRVYLGHAFKIKDFSVGFNASYLFGYLKDNQTILFPSSYSNFRQQNSVNINSLYFDYGLQYEHTFYDSSFVAISAKDTAKRSFSKRFKNSYKKFINGFTIGFGFTFNSPTKLASKENSIVGHPDLGDGFTDTLLIQNNKVNIMLPTNIGFGLVLRKENKFLIGLDYQYTKWSEFYNQSIYYVANTGTSMVDNWNAGIGLELYYKKRFPIRIGYHYTSSYLIIDGQPINTKVFTLGMGLPFSNKISKSITMMNIAVEIGQVGTTNNNLIRDDFVRATLGISILEKWFTKSKYF